MSTQPEVSDLLICNITECASDWRVPAENFPFHRLYYIYSGDTLYESALESFTLQNNTIYLFPVNLSYKLSHNPSNPLHCLWFHFCTNKPILNNKVTKIRIETENATYFYLKALEQLVINKCSDISVFNYTINSLLFFFHQQGRIVLAQEKGFNTVLEYIHRNFQKNPSNERLAEIVNLAPKYFIRKFKSIYLKTPQRYISEFKLLQASKLLLTGARIKDVSYSVGFEDVKAFSRFFKLAKGISPSEYKKSYSLQP